MDYVNVEKKKKDYINSTGDEKHVKESSFKAFNQFLRRWDSIKPPVRKIY
ncbi:MAG TPA: hypothetical protein VLU38_00685 [Methanomassiliicoccales archaeon]|nr:hypothetical protein [Methanomassiliicoccales archaeon]